MNKKKQHWENVFHSKTPEQVSWTEAYPKTSVDLINSFNLDKSAPIIDIGGGDSLLVDSLLDLGLSDITILDISGKALERAQERLGNRAKQVEWIESDILSFSPNKEYALWHDRASFHFLTNLIEIQKYTKTVNKSNSRHLIMGTFSNSGPKKCSGLPITQYDCEKLKNCFSDSYKHLGCIKVEHTTPFETKQAFIFSKFNKKI